MTANGTMTFQQAFQQAVLLSCPDAPAPTDERFFSFTTRYRKSHATLSWTIDDFSIRDANEEKLEVEFGAGEAAEETRWKLQCFFGSCNDEHKDFICLTLDLVSPGPSRNAGMEISLVTPDGRKPCFKRVKCHHFKLNNDGHRSGIHSKVTRSYLNENAAQLVPGDKLTIQCKLAVFGETSTDTEVKNGSKQPNPELKGSDLGRSLGRLLTLPDDPDLMDSDEVNQPSFSPPVENTHSDLELSVGGVKFQAHKAILAARSSVFARMFDHNMREKEDCLVEIADMDPQVMRHFLRFIYTGELGPNLDVQMAKDLFTAADKYEIRELLDFCEAFMSRNLTAENVPYIMVLAHLHDCPELKQQAMEFFSSSAGRVMESPAWDEVVAAHPALVNDTLRVMAKRHAASDSSAESPKKKLKFSPSCFNSPN